MLIDRVIEKLKKDNESDPFFEGIVCFKVDNVAEYLNNNSSYKMVDSVPNAAPLFKQMWFEHKIVRRLQGLFGIKRVGVQICATECPHEDGEFTVLRDKLLDKYPNILTARWLLYGAVFFEGFDGEIHFVDAYSILPLNKLGKVDLTLTNNKVIGVTTSPPGTVNYLVSQGYASIWITPLVSISFAHCKNTTILENIPPVKLQKSRIKKGKNPLIKYHTLEIKPMVRIIKENSQHNSSGVKNALHICRGHFKDYTGKGLFGKYRGLYWWHDLVRGNATSGISVKDYEVSPN